MPTILRLHSIIRGCNCHISSKQHETCNPQQCIVPIRTQGSQQSERPHDHCRHWGHSHQQWSGSQHVAYNKSSDVIFCRGQTWRIFHQRQNGSLHVTHSWENGTSTNSNPHTNWQFNCPCTTHQQNYAQCFEGRGHLIPLVALPQSTGPVSFLLESWDTNLADYWTKHHPASHHKAYWQQILTSSTSKMATEVFPSSHENFHPLTSLKNTATESFVKNLINTSICGITGSTTMNNCSQRHLMAQWQGCVRLAGNTSWRNSNRIPQNAIPAKAHSVVQ